MPSVIAWIAAALFTASSAFLAVAQIRMAIALRKGVRKLSDTTTRLGTVAGELAADEQKIETLLADNASAIATLKSQGADPAAIAQLEAIHAKFEAILAPIGTSETGTGDVAPPAGATGTTTP